MPEHAADERPTAEPNVPAGQSAHAEAPTTAEKEPLLQTTHAADAGPPVGFAEPAEHAYGGGAMQDDADVELAGDVQPAGQAVHDDAPSAAHELTAHGDGDPTPAAHEEPAGQIAAVAVIEPAAQ